MRAAVVALLALLDRSPLVLADHEHLLVFEFGEAGDDGAVIAEGSVAVQLDELVEDQFDVIERLRALCVPGDVLDDVPGIEILERLPALLVDLQPQIADGFFGSGRGVRLGLEGFELPFELSNRLFEREGRRSSWWTRDSFQRAIKAVI